MDFSSLQTKGAPSHACPTRSPPAARVTTWRPALVIERALFLIFALQQMIVDHARLALPDDRPACERGRLCDLERIARFDVEKAVGGDKRHRQIEGAAEQILAER